MHVRAEPRQVDTNKLFWTQLQKSLDALEPYAKTHRVRIAVENLFPDNFDTLEKIFTRYGPDYIGLCYDSGHGSISNGQMDRLERIKDRLISIHLNDNDGASDQHKLPFSGTVDWTRLARIIGESAYAKCVNLEVMIHNTGIEDEPVFLEKAFESGTTFARLVEEHRNENRL
jgi:sugar phosphate isomerase/epimerase